MLCFLQGSWTGLHVQVGIQLPDHADHKRFSCVTTPCPPSPSLLDPPSAVCPLPSAVLAVHPWLWGHFRFQCRHKVFSRHHCCGTDFPQWWESLQEGGLPPRGLVPGEPSFLNVSKTTELIAAEGLPSSSVTLRWKEWTLSNTGEWPSHRTFLWLSTSTQLWRRPDSICSSEDESVFMLPLKVLKRLLKLHKSRLLRVVHSAERTIRTILPNLQDIYAKRCTIWAKKILKQSSHTGHTLFSPLPWGWHLRCMRTKLIKLIFS